MSEYVMMPKELDSSEIDAFSSTSVIICRKCIGSGLFCGDTCSFCKGAGETSLANLYAKLVDNSSQPVPEHEETLQRLRGQLQNCVNHLDNARRRSFGNHDEIIANAVSSANKCLYETLVDDPQPLPDHGWNDEAKELLVEMDEYLNTNNLTSIGAGSIFHTQIKDLIDQQPKPLPGDPE